MNKITAQVGQIIEVNGKQYRATESGFELVTVKRGPLGGELKRLGECVVGDRVVIVGAIVNGNWMGRDMAQIEIENLFSDGKRHVELTYNCPVETNLQPRPTFTPMTAGEAAKLPDIVGRWVAVKVNESETDCGYDQPLKISGQWIEKKEQILLIEGVDL